VIVDDYSRLPAAPDEHRVSADRSGVVTGLAAEPIGHAAVTLGAGRATLEDAIDPGVGVTVIAPPGTAVKAGETVLLVRHRAGRGLSEALPLLQNAVAIGEAAPPAGALIVETIGQTFTAR
jgi:thymidine phosphorylase